jgi:hypothetical protein
MIVIGHFNCCITSVVEKPTHEFTFVLKMKAAGSLKILVTIFEVASHHDPADNHLNFLCLKELKYHPALILPSSL